MLFHFVVSVSKVKIFNSLVATAKHIKFLLKRLKHLASQYLLKVATKALGNNS